MRTEDGGIFVGPDEGKALPNPVGGRMVVKVRDEDTAGAYSIHDNTIPPGSPGPRPHIHRYHEEAFYVLEGELTVRVGPRTILAPAGSFVVVPRGVVHRPSNPGPRPARFLLIFSPAVMDHFFEEAAEGHMPLQAAPTDTAILEELEAFTEVRLGVYEVPTKAVGFEGAAQERSREAQPNFREHTFPTMS